MTTSKILGRQKPAATTATLLYTAPAATQAGVNIFAANQSSSADTIRIALTPSGVVLSATDYIAYDVPLGGNTTLNLTGIELNTGDFVTVESGNGSTSFVATGLEVS
jgi:hypothetical protein